MDSGKMFGGAAVTADPLAKVRLQGGDKQAVIPPMLVGPHQAPPFLDDNGRVHDCAALLRERGARG